MSAASESRDELARLLSALADDTLDAADEKRLTELLQTDLSARAKYYEHAMLAALLRREGRRAAAHSDDVAGTLRVPLGDDGTRSVSATLPRRFHPWLLALAASLLLGLLLSVGEATGVTHFVPTIVRIVTGEGSLVIEVDDPSVSVTIEGEDIRITGAGLHELRLRPGKHKVLASKDGQPVAVDQPIVMIAKGGKRIVKVVREATLDSPSPASPQAAELARRTADVERNPDDLKARIERGLIYVRLNRLDEAFADYSCVIDANSGIPEYSSAYVGRAEIRQARGDWEGAIADFEQRARIVPNQGMAAGRLALIYLFGPLEFRDPEKAAQQAELAARIQPNDHGYVTLHGIACYRVGRLDEAIQTLQRAATLPPGADSRDLFALALCYHATGQAEKADAYHTKAVLAWPRTKSAQDATQVAFWQAFHEEAEAMLAAP